MVWSQWQTRMRHTMPHLQFNYANAIWNAFYCILMPGENWRELVIINDSVDRTIRARHDSHFEWRTHTWITKMKKKTLLSIWQHKKKNDIIWNHLESEWKANNCHAWMDTLRMAVTVTVTSIAVPMRCLCSTVHIWNTTRRQLLATISINRKKNMCATNAATD